jgi:hypothetical protein
MKTRNTLILLVIAAALFAFMFFYERHQPTTRDAMELDAAVMVFNPEIIDGILISNNESQIKLHSVNGVWQMDAPVADRADLNAVGLLLTLAATLQKEGTLTGADKDFAVADSNVRLKLSGPGAPPEIYFGKDAAVEGRGYLRLAGSDTVYVARNVLKSLVMKKADDYRDHRLTDLNVSQVNRIILKTAAGEIELQKNRDRWEFNKPIKTRADGEKVSALISRVVGAHIDSFIPEKEANAAATGLADPRGVITLFTEDRDKPDVVQIGQPDGKDRVYGRISSRDSVCLLSTTAARALDVLPNDLRDTHLLPLNPDIVDRITIEPAGKPKVVLARNLESWTIKSLGDLPVNAAEMKRFAAAMQKQQVAVFVTDVASDLAKYGLDQPQIRVTFSSFASENTAESQAGEHPICTLSLGAVEGDCVYARLEGEPFVMAVNKSLLNNILTDAAQWRDLSIFKFQPADIVLIELEREGRPPVAFARDAGGGWKLTKGGGGLNGVAVQSLCNALASLRAVRRTGAETGGLGFDKPALAITFTTSDKKTARLVVGNLAPGSMWNAMTDDANGAFVLSRPDVEVMQADFVEK